MRDKQRTADIEPWYVQAELGPPLACKIGEVVVGVEILISEELPHASMEIVSAGLQNHEDSAA